MHVDIANRLPPSMFLYEFELHESKLTIPHKLMIGGWIGIF